MGNYYLEMQNNELGDSLIFNKDLTQKGDPTFCYCHSQTLKSGRGGRGGGGSKRTVVTVVSCCAPKRTIIIESVCMVYRYDSKKRIVFPFPM